MIGHTKVYRVTGFIFLVKAVLRENGTGNRAPEVEEGAQVGEEGASEEKKKRCASITIGYGSSLSSEELSR